MTAHDDQRSGMLSSIRRARAGTATHLGRTVDAWLA